MFYVINRFKNKITFNSIDEMFAYMSANDVVEGFAGYKV
jgi:hypothetical protein